MSRATGFPLGLTRFGRAKMARIRKDDHRKPMRCVFDLLMPGEFRGDDRLPFALLTLTRCVLCLMSFQDGGDFFKWRNHWREGAVALLVLSSASAGARFVSTCSNPSGSLAGRHRQVV